MWAVLKLLTEDSFTTPFGPVKFENDIAGYIPVFKTEDEAIEAACNGKFIIMPIQEANPNV